VLLLGETGTGKELLAHAIHALGAGAQGVRQHQQRGHPRDPAGSRVLRHRPRRLHRRRAQGPPGKLQIAQGGTLFLDEIGDMPLPLQSKLLRVLQEKEFEPVGSNEMLHSDVRVIAATSIDLQAAIKRGEFRADLYYRLNVLPIQVPLRERLEDLPALCEAILEELRSQHELEPRPWRCWGSMLAGEHSRIAQRAGTRNAAGDDLVLNVADIARPLGL
jgi:DNA-binding NtrC family response regulator